MPTRKVPSPLVLHNSLKIAFFQSFFLPLTTIVATTGLMAIVVPCCKCPVASKPMLLTSIVGGVAISSGRSQTMMTVLKRSIHPDDLPTDVEEDQVTGFLGGGLPENAQIWSKAGWTSQVRHDAAYIEVPDKPPYLLVVFTEGKANAKNREILPYISKLVTEALDKL